MHIVFDIGGTKMRVAGSRDLKGFLAEPVVVDTPPAFKDGAALLKKIITEVSLSENIENIAGGVAGPLDQRLGVLVGGPNLGGWVGNPLRDEVSDAFRVPVFLQNDSALVGLGEMHFGAGTAEGVAAYLTVSTGVGGARYVGGHIDSATIGFEPGHQIIDAGRALCPDCSNGTLEALIGGAATEKRTGKKPYDIQDEQFWDDYAKRLAYGLNNLIVHWSPERIVLGGSMIVGDPAISIDRAKEYLRDIMTIYPTLPEIRKAKLGSLGGLYGAMALLKNK